MLVLGPSWPSTAQSRLAQSSDVILYIKHLDFTKLTIYLYWFSKYAWYSIFHIESFFLLHIGADVLTNASRYLCKMWIYPIKNQLRQCAGGTTLGVLLVQLHFLWANSHFNNFGDILTLSNFRRFILTVWIWSTSVPLVTTNLLSKNACACGSLDKKQ